ncbi:MAG: molybdopterin molybdotransferase MoeA [Deltaproteobacteria bacterium]|nr:molybdopterin molybdotransferase MoeA [Deltaproteobacteria bacterium]
MSGPGDLLPVDDAVDIVIRAAQELARNSWPTRQLSLWDASGFILAEDICADRDQPPFDRAMMDGFALRAADVAAGPTTLRVVGEVAAGSDVDLTVGEGEAVAIMTGAPLPRGADTIVMVERTSRPDDGHVSVPGPLERGDNVAPRGQEVREGQVVAASGRVVESLTAGVLASVGAHRVTVRVRPRVTVITTGSELVPIEATPGPAQIRDSNRRTMFAFLEREWARVVDGGIVADEMNATRMAIREGLDSDVLVLSGGVSAGSYDIVRAALEEEGVEILFHKVRIKPGKPVLFGRHAGGLVFGLPGNPVSAFVAGLVLLGPALRVLGRRPEPASWYVRLPLVGELPATAGRTTFHAAELVRGDDDQLAVRYRPTLGSADQVAVARGNSFIRTEPGAPAARDGDLVRVLLPHSPVSW